MNAFDMTRRGNRHGLALLSAVGVAHVVLLLTFASTWRSPSYPPGAFDGSFLVGNLVILVLNGALLSVWLVPGCLAGWWFMRRSRVRGLPATVIIGLAVTLVACASMYVLVGLFAWPPSTTALESRTPVEIEVALFVVTWFVVLDRLTPRPEAAEGTRDQIDSLARRCMRTAGATLGVAAVLGHFALVGGIIGGIEETLGGEGTYRPKSTSVSPSGASRAYVVDYCSSGGVLGNCYAQVYLLPTAERWTPKHRGLLVWQARHLDVSEVTWESERSVLVRIDDADLRRYEEYVDPYPRSGFLVRTAGVPAKMGVPETWK